tara:strand:- start:35 stop:193 length:159 start_codon:yes stop_codon:yes gene_type:complete
MLPAVEPTPADPIPSNLQLEESKVTAALKAEKAKRPNKKNIFDTIFNWLIPF